MVGSTILTQSRTLMMFFWKELLEWEHVSAQRGVPQLVCLHLLRFLLWLFVSRLGSFLQAKQLGKVMKYAKFCCKDVDNSREILLSVIDLFFYKQLGSGFQGRRHRGGQGGHGPPTFCKAKLLKTNFYKQNI